MDATHTFAVSLSITVIGFLLTYLFTKKPKLRYYYGAITEIPFPVTDTNNNTSDASAQNASATNAPATNDSATNDSALNKTPKFNFVRTHTIVISNQGNASAKNVRIGHYTLPPYSVSIMTPAF